MDKKVLNEREAADYIGMSSSYLRHDRCHGATRGRTPGPVFIKIGKVVRYQLKDLDDWLNLHKVNRVVNF